MKKRMGTALLALIWLFGLTTRIESGSSDKPYIRGCDVWSSNTSHGMETALDVQVSDPDGSVPGSISSVRVTMPDGVNGYNFDLVTDHLGSGEYFHKLSGAPDDGQYTFTVTDNNGNTVTSYFTLAAGAETIPLPDTATFRASGSDPLAPTLSWSTIPGYSDNLYYRVRVQQTTAPYSTVYTSPRDFIGTSGTVPGGVLQSGQSYQWWVEAFDSGSGLTANKRAQSQSIPLTVNSTRPYFTKAAVFKWHNQDGSFSTGLWAVGGNPAGQALSLTVSGPNGFNYTTPVDSCFTNQCVLNVPGIPTDGLYTFQVRDAGNSAVSYFHLKSYDVPRVDSATMRASGDPLAPVLSWGAPVDVERPLYYQVHMFTNQSVWIWSSSWVTNTFLSVPQGILQPGVSYEWHVIAYDDRSLGPANRSITNRIPLTIDNASPYFTYATVNDRHDFDGQFIGINVQLVDPDGTLPGSLASLTVTGPSGFSQAFQASDYTRDINEYFRRISGIPQEGLYTFTAVDVNGNSAVTHHYHRPAQGSIPLLGETSFQVSGNPLAPTISWSTVSGYPRHLYYRVRINDRQGNMVYHTPQPFPPDSYQVVPSGKLVAGAVYRYRVEAYDSPYFQTFDNRSNSSFRPLMVDTDNDGMDDGWEIQYFGSLARTGSGDFDGDGLTDLQEFQYGTSPILIDTDGDGYGDGTEVAQGTDPLNGNSKPGIPGAPFFAYCNVMAIYNAFGGASWLSAQVYDLGGTVPGSIASVTITEPGGAVTTLSYSGNNVYGIWVAGGIPPEGEYTFRVTDNDGNTATSSYYHHAGPAIPLADTQSFMATGNSLTPTLSWGAIPGYQGNLFYRAQILRGNTTVWTSGFTTNTFGNVPASANLQAGESYQWQVQAFDNYRFEVSDHRSTSATVPLSVGSDTRPYFRSATIINRHRTDGFFTQVSVTLTDPNGTLPGSITSITVELVDTQGQPLQLIHQYDVRPMADGGDYDPMWASFDHLIPGRPVDGIYRFTAVDVEGKQAVTYDYLKSNDIPMVDWTTMRASGDPYASVGPTLTFSWGAPADMDRPLYYHAMISEFDGAGNEVRELWRSSYTPETSVAVPAQNLPLAPLQSPSSYRWKVRAYDGNYYVHNNRSDTDRIALTIDNSRPYIRTAGIYHSRYNDGDYTAMDSFVLDPEGDSKETTEWVRVTGPNSYYHQYQQEDLIWGGMAAYPNEWWYLAPSTLEPGVYTVTAKKKGQTETVVTHEFLDTARDIPLPDENSFKVVLSGDPAVSWSAIVSWPATPGFQDHLFYRVRVKDSGGNILYNPSREPLTAASIPSSIFPVQPSCEAAPRESYFLRMETYDKREFPIIDNRSVSRYLPLHPQLDLASIGATWGADVRVPLTLKNAPGVKISSTSNTIVFDPMRLDFQGVDPGEAANVAGKVVSDTVVDVGRIRVDISGNNNPMGNGVVAYVHFRVIEGTGFMGDIPVKNCPSATTPQGDSVYTGGTWGSVSVMSPRGSCPSGSSGISWMVPADYPTIQGALNTANDGDTVLVSPGIYRVDRLNFNGKRISLNCAGAAGSCILDGSSKNQLFKLTSGEGNDSVICGFTIQNGFADYGGAIFLGSASPTFQNCTITGNTATTGGGAIHSKNSTPIFRACTISANSAMNGGGIFLDSSSPTFDRCWISRNSATDGTGRGGAAYAMGPGAPVFVNCLLDENHAGVATGAGGTGGAIHAESGSVTVTNCTLEGNQALGASAFGGAVSTGTGLFTIANSILWSNLAGGVANQVYGNPGITTSDVQGGYPGLGNIASDPLFVNRAMGQYQLQPGSPAIDRGDVNAAGGIGTQDLYGNPRLTGATVDMGAFEAPATVPGAPTGVSATAGNAMAAVSFSPPSSDGGSPIISYSVISDPDGITQSGPSSPITVTGLTNGTAYTFTVTATNALGTGPASGPSNSVTPSPAAMLNTAPITAITATTATSGGNIVYDGGTAITARGVCWNTMGNPTTSDAHTIDGTGGGAFASSITGLAPNTTYHVRAYATNSTGTTYGNDVVFTTLAVYTITASAGPNGSIDPMGAVTVTHGGSQTFTINPDPGCRIVSVVVDGVSVGAVASYPFTNVTGNHMIAAAFAPVVPVFTISASAGPNGSINPSGAVHVLQGADQSFAIIPDGGYGVADVLVDGVPMGPTTSYTFPNVQGNHTIAASFSFMGTWYRDADSDGFGDPIVSMQSAVQPPGYVSDNSDCDDSDARLHPGTVWFNDYDGDGYSSGSTMTQCSRPAGFVLPDELIVLPNILIAETVDCDDFHATVHPGAAKVCGRDVDCSGQIYNDPECRIVSDTIVVPMIPNTNDPIPVRAGEPIWVTATFHNNTSQPMETIRPDCFNTTFTLMDADGQVVPPLDRMRVAYGIPDDVIAIQPGEVFSVTCNVAEMVRPEVLEPGSYKVEATYSNAIRDPDLNPVTNACANPPCFDLWTGAVSSPAAPVQVTADPPALTLAAKVTFNPQDWNVQWGVLPGMTVTATLSDIEGHGVSDIDLTTLQLNGIAAQSHTIDTNTDRVTALFDGYQVARSLGTVVSGSVVYPTLECRLVSVGIPEGDNVRASGRVVMVDQPPAIFYRDADGDGFGNPDPTYSIQAWTAPPGYAANNLDPDDSRNDVTPNTLWFKDFDGDGYSDGTTLVQVDRPPGYRLAIELQATSGDCDDSDALVHPGAIEICDGKDNNCNGGIDDGLGDLCTHFAETISVPATPVRPGEPLWVTATFTNDSGAPIQTIRPDCFNTTFTVQDESGSILPPLDRLRVAYGIPDDVITIKAGEVFRVTCNLSEMFRPEVLTSGEAGEPLTYKVQATYSNLIQDPDIDAGGHCTHPSGICYPLWTGAVASPSVSSVAVEGMPVERLAADITFDPAFWFVEWASSTGRRIKATIRNVTPASIDPSKVRLNGVVPIVSGLASISGGALTVQFDAAAAVRSLGAAVPGMFYPSVEGFASTTLFSGGKAVRLTVVGDYDGDGDIDSMDVNILLQYRNKPAGVCPDCDLDGDKMITVLDARKLVLKCTRPGCATR